MKKLLIFVIVIALLLPLAGCDVKTGNSIVVEAQIAAGSNHSLAVKTDGSLWAWGSNEYGQLGNGISGDGEFEVTPQKVMDSVVAVAAGIHHSMTIKADGSLWTWGSNSAGQLGNGKSGEDEQSSEPIKIMDDCVDIAVGATFSMAIKKDGSLWTWGNNGVGQLGNGKIGKETSCGTPEKIMDDVATIAAGAGHGLAIKKDGSLWVWGLNISGQIGNGKRGIEENVSTPVKIMDDVATVSGGFTYSMAVKSDGSLWSWGVEFGLGTDSEGSNTPVEVMNDVKAISAGDSFCMAIKTDNSLWSWGMNNVGQLGLGSGYGLDCETPEKVMDDCAKIAAGESHSLAIKSDGSLHTWGNNDYGQLGNGLEMKIREPIELMGDVVSVAAGAEFSMAIKKDDSLWVWGSNNFGQLGNDKGAYGECSYIPEKVMDDCVAVAAGYYHSMAIKKDGSLWTWGSNKYGQIGDGEGGEEVISTSPKKIMDDVVAIAAGDFHCMAIKKDGSLWVWGDNSYFELGNGKGGANVFSKAPEKIMDDCMAVAAGTRHSMALKSDGSLWAWGSSMYNGAVGDGSEKGSKTPVKIMDEVKSISAGAYNSMAIKNDDSLWIWGDNNYGQLGNGKSGNKEYTNKPEKLFDNALFISAGSGVCMAIKNDESLWIWGDNSFNNGVEKEIIAMPTKIMESVVSAASGSRHNMAIKKDGTLWIWGDNTYGQVGNSMDNRIPAFVMNLSVS